MMLAPYEDLSSYTSKRLAYREWHGRGGDCTRWIRVNATVEEAEQPMNTVHNVYTHVHIWRKSRDCLAREVYHLRKVPKNRLKKRS